MAEGEGGAQCDNIDFFAVISLELAKPQNFISLKKLTITLYCSLRGAVMGGGSSQQLLYANGLFTLMFFP